MKDIIRAYHFGLSRLSKALHLILLAYLSLVMWLITSQYILGKALSFFEGRSLLDLYSLVNFAYQKPDQLVKLAIYGAINLIIGFIISSTGRYLLLPRLLNSKKSFSFKQLSLFILLRLSFYLLWGLTLTSLIYLFRSYYPLIKSSLAQWVMLVAFIGTAIPLLFILRLVQRYSEVLYLIKNITWYRAPSDALKHLWKNPLAALTSDFIALAIILFFVWIGFYLRVAFSMSYIANISTQLILIAVLMLEGLRYLFVGFFIEGNNN